MIEVVIDTPQHAGRVHGAVQIRGYALADGVPVRDVTVSLGREAPVRPTTGLPRPDVVESQGLEAQSVTCGFETTLAHDTPGLLHIRVVARHAGEEKTDERRAYLTSVSPAIEVVAERDGDVVLVSAELDHTPRSARAAAGEAGAGLFTLGTTVTGAVTAGPQESDAELVVINAAGLKAAGRAPLPALDPPAAATMPLEIHSRPSVSVIVPCHNGEALTRACLGAVLATVPDGVEIELIAVDDASTDGTGQLLAAMAADDDRLQVIAMARNVGYMRAVSAAVERASNEILVHLNNDAVPRPGWLEALLHTLESVPDAGIVGGKLVLPDRRLQEAGCTVFDDADVVGLGRGEDPRHPLLQHMRDVDYVSFATAAIPRALWDEVGGLDDRFAPLYYDDVDICFAVRAAGRRVLYQPECVVDHIENASMQGARPAEPPNRAAFADKWAKALVGHPVHPGFVDDASLAEFVAGGRPLVTVVAESPPREELEQVDGLAVLLLTGDEADPAEIRALRQRGVCVLAAPWTRGAPGSARVQSPRVLASLPREEVVVVGELSERGLALVGAALPGATVRNLSPAVSS